MDFDSHALAEEGYMSERKIRVLIADDQKLFAENLKTVIETRADDLCVVGIAQDGEEAVRLAKELWPDVVLMDVCMPRLDGVKAIRELKRDLPKIKILVLTTFGDDDYVLEALKFGATGYLLKDISMPELIQTIRGVGAGNIMISPEVAITLLRNIEVQREEQSAPGRRKKSRMDGQPRRERQVLKLIGAGCNNYDIGSRLGLSEQTVKNYVSSIYEKTGIHDRIQIMRTAETLARFLEDS